VVMQELQRVFAEPTDVTTIGEITKKRGDIDKLQLKRQLDAKKLIKDLTQRTTQLGLDLSRKDRNGDDHRTQLETLDRQKENLSSNITNYDKQIAQLKVEIEDLKRRTEELKTRRSQIETQRLDDAPRLKLYQCISNIKWDYETPMRVKGHVDIVDQKRQLVKDVRPFDIDPLQYGSFEIANMLWELMD